MQTVKRLADERGLTKIDWLTSYHTFSFGDYYDPDWHQFNGLRVINDDVVAPGAGFDTHPHRDMEIITYVVDGAVEHEDTLGTKQVIKAGEVQLMRAGTGIAHSEYNHSHESPVRFLQIWIPPRQQGLEPSYQQHAFTAAEKQNQWCLLVSPEGGDKVLHIEAPVKVYARIIKPGEEVEAPIDLDQGGWLQVVRGTLSAAGEDLTTGDGLGVVETDGFKLTGGSEETEVIWFQLSAS